MIKLILGLKRGNELCYSRLDSTRRNGDDHKKCNKCIELAVINRGKHSQHKEVIEEIKQVEETNANEHQSRLSEKLVSKSHKFQ